MEKKIISICIFIIYLHLSYSQIASTSNLGSTKWVVNSLVHKEFIENKGQFDNYGLNNIKFAYSTPSLTVYFTLNGIVYQYKDQRQEEEYLKEKNKKEDEEQLPNIEQVEMNWIDCNSTVEIKAEKQLSYYFTYANKKNEILNTIIAYAYEKIVYKNIYPFIDIEFYFPEGKEGLKYNVILHPGADISQLKMKYSGVLENDLDAQGNLTVETPFGIITDQAPLSSYENGEFISSSFEKKENIFSFKIDKSYNKAKTVIIDPWSVTTLFSNSTAYPIDIEYDLQGNVYVFNRYELIKYDNTGKLQWIYPITFTLSTVTFAYAFTIDAKYGISYLASAGGIVSKINNQGIALKEIILADFPEVWRAAFDNCARQIIISGGYEPDANNIAAVLDTNLNVVSYGINNVSEPIALDGFLLASGHNGFYFVGFVGYDAYGNKTYNEIHKCSNGSSSSLLSFYLGDKIVYGAYASATGCYYNGVAANQNYLYATDGSVLKKWDVNTAALISSTTISSVIDTFGGIDVDQSDNIYIGYYATIRKYDSNLNFLSSYNVSGIVRDVKIGSNNTLYVCGDNFVQTIQLSNNNSASLKLSINAPSVICQGTVATASVVVSGGTAPYTYAWSNGQSDSIVNNLAEGTYTVTVTDNSCPAQSFTDIVVIKVDDIQLTTTSINSTCLNNDGQAAVVISGGNAPFNYSWSNGKTTPQISNLTSGSYVITVTDSNGCSITDSVVVSTNNDLLLSTSSMEEHCNLQDGIAIVVVSGGTGNYTYVWNTNPIQTNDTAVGLKAGNYTVTVTDDSCSVSAVVFVDSFSSPILNFITTNEQCGAKDGTATVNASGGTGSYTYLWNTGASGASATGLSAGTYVVTVDDGYCTTVDSVDVLSDDSPIVILNKADESCGQSNGAITTVVSGGTGSYTYSWSNGATTSSINNLTAGTYFVIVNDGICSVSDSTTITSTVAPSTSFTANHICLNDSAVFINNSTISSGSISTYVWDFGDGGSSSLTTPSHLYSSAGSYTITLIAIAASNCADTSIQTINVYDVPQAAISVANICDQQIAYFNDATNNNGTLITSWLWDFNGVSSATEQNPNVLFPSAGTYNSTLVVTTTDGCTDTASSTIEVYPMPIADYTTNSVCLNQVNNFTNLSYVSSGNMNYHWEFGEGSTSVTPSPIHTYPSEGTYNVTLKTISDKGCIDSITQTLTIYPLPNVDFIADKLNGCIPLEINFTNNSTISSTNIQSYLWEFGNGNTSTNHSPNHIFTQPGIYSVSLTAFSDKGCINDTSLQIEAYSLPLADFSFSPTEISILNPSVEFTDLSLDPTAWNWLFGDGNSSLEQNPQHIFTDTGTYQVELWINNQYGCIDSASGQLRIEPEFMLYIPNTFTPNSDGVNDIFNAKGWGVVELQLSIFNRWGKLIYVTTDLNKGWDGRINNNHTQEDVYLYHISTVDVLKKTHSYNGKVNLVR